MHGTETSTLQDLIDRLDPWIEDNSQVAAVTVRQPLQPAGGGGTEIFPPTYPKPQEWGQDHETRGKRWLGYNIDQLPDGTSVCLVDSVPAQAHRMSALFKQERYRDLVPQVRITVRDSHGKEVGTVDLLDVGHRAADFLVRRSTLGDMAREAFSSLARGDATPMARFSPTSLLFGAWDSRDTQVKTPRVIRSLIRAYDATPLTRSTAYNYPVNYRELGLLESLGKVRDDVLYEEGVFHKPGVMMPGGVLCREIVRLSSLSLVALRALSAPSPEASRRLRRYILGLALVCLTAPHQPRLREGCELVPVPGRPAEAHLVHYDGTREPLVLPSHEDALEYARHAARELRISKSIQGEFDTRAARKVIRDRLGKKQTSEGSSDSANNNTSRRRSRRKR